MNLDISCPIFLSSPVFIFLLKKFFIFIVCLSRDIIRQTDSRIDSKWLHCIFLRILPKRRYNLIDKNDPRLDLDKDTKSFESFLNYPRSVSTSEE